MQQRKEYLVNIGAGGQVSLPDLLSWIGCVVKPTNLGKNTAAKGEQPKASGFLTSVIHQSIKPIISLSTDTVDFGPDETEGLDYFLTRENYENFSKGGVQVQIILLSRLTFTVFTYLLFIYLLIPIRPFLIRLNLLFWNLVFPHQISCLRTKIRS